MQEVELIWEIPDYIVDNRIFSIILTRNSERELKMQTLLSTQQLAEYLGITAVTIRRKAARGEIPHIRIHGRLRFDRQVIDRWLLDNSRGMRMQILVFDDDPTIGQLFSGILASYKEFQLTVVSSGKEAIAMFARQNFDMVFLDLAMPGMNGVEVLAQIRSISPDIPVAIITAYSDSSILVEAGQYSPCLSIFKPFSRSQIIGAVKSMQLVIAATAKTSELLK